MRKATGGKKPMIVARIIKSPIRAISKALDLYAKYMANFATNNYNTPLMIMETIPHAHELRRRLNTPPSDGDHLAGPLIRAISTTPVIRNSSVSITRRLHVPRTHGGGMRTIDEDRAYSFRDDGIGTTKKLANKICFLVSSVRR